MIGRKKNSEKAFALPLALLLLVVMSLMGSILISKTTTEHIANTTKDLSQQSFYAAESGITAAKNWMISETGQDLLKNSSPSNIDRDLRFCKTSMFPNIISGSKGFKIERKSLNQVIDNLSSEELKRLKKFSYEYFITYTPAANGSTTTAKTKTANVSEGASITEGTSYKQSGAKTATYYTIYSCGCNNSANSCNINSDSITRLEQDVTLIK
tara:strand:- start:409 stop:1044 length:636 start_codon:yes stop_codon:yes gene_type:complete